MQTYKITATCTFGMESVLKRELHHLGYEIVHSTDGAQTVIGTMEDILRLNIWLRTANRVLIPIATFPAESFDELFDNTFDIPWENYLPGDSICNVSKISCVKSNIFSKSDSQRIIKKAIVERMKRHYKYNRLPETGDSYPLFVTIKNNIATISLNTSGESLHRRGYRLDAGIAPLKETLAAGIVYLSHVKEGQQFADFMCGSGTFIIEAAMILADIAPGLNRKFMFESWHQLDKEKNADIREEIRSERKDLPLRLLGSDIDKSVLRAARENARRAGVENLVSFQKQDFREFRSRKKCGVLVCNPPYAERLGERKETELLYHDMREIYESLDNWSLFVLCGHPEFQRYFGKKATKNRKLYNGNMLTYLYQYFPKK